MSRHSDRGDVSKEMMAPEKMSVSLANLSTPGRRIMMSNSIKYKRLLRVPLVLLLALLLSGLVMLTITPGPVRSQGGGLEISKSGPTVGFPGEPVNYTLTIANTGDTMVLDLLITDTLPAGATYLSGGSLEGNEVQWTIPMLDSQESVQVSFAVAATETITNSSYGATGIEAEAPVKLLGGGSGSQFGLKMAISDDTLLVKNYVFVHNGTSWTQQTTLPQAADNVAIDDDTAVLGQIWGSSSGRAYIFKRNGTNWAQEDLLIPGDGEFADNFGQSVAVDGDTAIIGAPNHDAEGEDTGAAYIYVRSGSSWTLQQKITTADVADLGKFGFSVDLDGDTAVISFLRDNNNRGAAYVYVRSEGDWTLEQKLMASDGGAWDIFATQVALSGDTLIVGRRGDDDQGANSGAAYIFERNSSSWTEEQKLVASDGEAGDLFGVSVDIVGDRAVVGANADDDQAFNAGAIYFYTRDGNGWSEQRKLTASDGAELDWLGRGAVISEDWIVGGADGDDDQGTNSGSAYVFGDLDLSTLTATGQEPVVTTIEGPDLSGLLTAVNDSPTLANFTTTFTASDLTGSILFFEDFETITDTTSGGFVLGSDYVWNTSTSVWNLHTPNDECIPPAPSDSTVAYFGYDFDCTYTETGGGTLDMAEPVWLPDSGSIHLSFESYEDIDCTVSGGSQSSIAASKAAGLASPLTGLPDEQGCTITDKLLVEITWNDGDTWQQLAELDHNGQGWYTNTISLAEYSGQQVRIRFNLDGEFGEHETLGWMIDNVAITSLAPPLVSLFSEDFETVENLDEGFGFESPGEEYIWYCIECYHAGDPTWNLEGPDDECLPAGSNNSTVAYFGNRWECTYYEPTSITAQCW
jgi:uncharacterized repeat protein (TIGR01451 family)